MRAHSIVRDDAPRDHPKRLTLCSALLLMILVMLKPILTIFRRQRISFKPWA